MKSFYNVANLPHGVWYSVLLIGTLTGFTRFHERGIVGNDIDSLVTNLVML